MKGMTGQKYEAVTLIVRATDGGEKMEQICNLPVLASAHSIDLLKCQNSEWVDGETIGGKLGYKEPRIYITRLYQRHKNEFKDGETIVVKLTTMVFPKKGHKPYTFERKTRLFSVPHGAFRLCMISDAPNRQGVHDEILDLFDTYRFGYMLKSLPGNQPIACTDSFMKEVKKNLGLKKGKEIIKSLFSGTFDGKVYFTPIEELARMSDGTDRRIAVVKEAEKRGCSLGTVYKDIERYRKGFNIPKSPTKLTGEPRRSRSNKGTTKYIEEKAKVIEFVKGHPEYMGMGNRFKECRKKNISAILGIEGISSSTICKWIREYVSIH